MRLPSYVPGRARLRYRRMLGVGLCLLGGGALVLTPACGGGGGTTDDDVQAFGAHTAAVSALPWNSVGRVAPECGGGSAGGNDVVSA